MGQRIYQLSFRTGKAYYECHQKQTLPICIGAEIRFTGEWRGEGKHRHFYLSDIMDSDYMEELEARWEEDKRKKALFEENKKHYI
jgi:hypothetical protein